VLTVSDDGPGLSEAEGAVLERQSEIDQLAHGSGLGLREVRWALDA